MPSPFENKWCAVCGEPATCAVRDILKITVSAGTPKQFEPRGEFEYLCREHKREPKTYDENGDVVDEA